MKKLLSLVIVLCLAVTMFAGISGFAEDGEYQVVIPPAGNPNLVSNGGFDNGLAGFSTAIKAHVSVITEEGRGNVVRVERTAEWDADRTLGVNSSVSTSITGLEPGSTYQLAVDLKIASLGETSRTIRRGPMFMLVFSDSTQANFPAITDTNSTWETVGGSFVVPEDCTSASVSLRFFGYGEIYWDNLEVVRLKGTNLVSNGGFENGLTGYSTAIASHVSVVSEDGHGNVIRVERTAEWDADKTLGVNSSVSTSISGLDPGSTYQLSVDLKVASLGATSRTVRRGPMFMITFADKTQANFPAITDTNQTWGTYTGTFTVPDGNTTATVGLRFFGWGEIYWDNLEVAKIQDSIKADMSTVTFHYTDWEEGSLKLDYKYSDFAGYTYDISIKDGSTVILTDTVAAADYIDYKFDLDLLTTIGKEYILTVDLKDPSGDVNTSYTKDIYRYNRPSHLTLDGQVLDGNGNIFYPVVGYTTLYEDLEQAASLGVNVTPAWQNEDKTIDARFSNIDNLITWLDEAWYEHGIMSLVCCYGKNYALSNGVGGAASCPENIELLRACVNAVKNHPGVLGYLVLDEPYNYEPTVGADEITRQLKEAYKIIRELDQDHLIMHTANKPDHWENSIDLSDVIISDRYPQSGLFHSLQYNYISKAKSISEGKKPVWNLLQAGKMSTDYDPNGNDLRNMIYQTMFAQGEGIGYIATSIKTSQNDGLLNHPDMITLTQGLTAGELADSVKAFVTGEYPTFCESVVVPYEGSVGLMGTTEVSEDYWYKAYTKNGQLYLLVLNHENASTSVSINLTSTDGTISIGEFTATVADAFNTQHTVTGNNVFTTTLAPRAAVLYKIDTVPSN